MVNYSGVKQLFKSKTQAFQGTKTNNVQILKALR